jgi:hypothetical protein
VDPRRARPRRVRLADWQRLRPKSHMTALARYATSTKRTPTDALRFLVDVALSREPSKDDLVFPVRKTFGWRSAGRRHVEIDWYARWAPVREIRFEAAEIALMRYGIDCVLRDPTLDPNWRDPRGGRKKHKIGT